MRARGDDPFETLSQNCTSDGAFPRIREFHSELTSLHINTYTNTNTLYFTKHYTQKLEDHFELVFDI